MVSGWFSGAGRAHRPAAAVLLLRRVHQRLRRHPRFRADDQSRGAMVARKPGRGRRARSPHGVRRRAHGRWRHRRARRSALLAGLASCGRRSVRPGDRPGARRVRADPAPARRVLGERGPAVGRCRLRRRRDHGAAAHRSHPDWCRERGQLPPHAWQPGGRGDADGHARRLVRPGGGHAAEGQAMDRPARSGHSADADRGCRPAGKAGFGVGQVALPESARASSRLPAVERSGCGSR